MNTVRWNVTVAPTTDKALRLYLASQGGGKKGDLSTFIEEAVRAQLFDFTAQNVKAANAKVSETTIASAINEALEWARANP
jgi:hypothetical protein